MEIVADRLDWTQFDSENWNRFLNTETGKRLLPKVLESAPGLLASGDTNAILIRAGEHRGLQLAISQLIGMSHADPDELTNVVETAYPPLEDDQKWNDGQTIDPSLNPKPPEDIS